MIVHLTMMVLRKEKGCLGPPSIPRKVSKADTLEDVYGKA